MNSISRKILLDTMIRHETLTIDDIGKAENLGFEPNPDHLKLLLLELTDSGFLIILPDVIPETYTITSKGIGEGNRLQEA